MESLNPLPFPPSFPVFIFRTAAENGVHTQGYRTVLKTLRNSKGKLILISKNCPPLRKSEIEYYAMPAKVGVHHYNRSNVDLGTTFGKYFRASCLSIIGPGVLLL